MSNVIDKLMDIIKQKFHSSCNVVLRKLLFFHNKCTLKKLKDLYLSKVFDVEGIDPVRLQCHCIMMDLFMYKIKPMNSAEKI